MAIFAKWGLSLYVEGIYDGLHGVHIAMFRALDRSSLWHVFLIMRLWYTFSRAPWMGGKDQIECRQCVEELMKYCPDRLRQLFNLFIPGIAIDIEYPPLQHDVARQDAMFTGYSKISDGE